MSERIQQTIINVNDMSLRQKLINYTAYGILMSALIAVSVVIYWLLQPADVYTVMGSRITVDPHNVKAGDAVHLTFNLCKNMDVSGTVTHTFVSDQTEVSAPTTVDNLSKICLKDYKATVPVPPQLGVGNYRIRYVGRYQINPIRSVRVEYYSDQFTVADSVVKPVGE